jgi:hypothetical protein
MCETKITRSYTGRRRFGDGAGLVSGQTSGLQTNDFITINNIMQNGPGIPTAWQGQARRLFKTLAGKHEWKRLVFARSRRKWRENITMDHNTL